ncbi:heparan-alpha-glucosaminide N-acetyltransferase domain-containing protein [Alteromonas ponticola]|uniref:Heparan-alpha-glucosaminide N-acetyltransferase domain-containing protein n=1 Tax=Alteromonas aquimaris TaxID=2998417 RepID=A0ABT3P6N2_9ALTE|nr:heparan-alpha-glucosaminide N-acetyltransferase domain-containing protein [Alteromonas aquimaris]MCW8108431.1 heparan-alpha-glucosaminide N-acetyltransferase domain-containing protein [Alteromonas aquimaris]
MTAVSSTRIEAIDILRGLSLAFMILVNNPGSWAHIYPPLRHASWHGITPTDLVFPFFLFVVGAAMAYSFKSVIERDEKPVLRVMKRGLLIAGIGFLLHLFPFDHPPEHWRYMGVLQRIGLCFILTGLLVLFVSPRHLIAVGIGALILYTMLLIGFSPAPYSLEQNAVVQLDLMLIGPEHMWKGKGTPFDPEGLLSTIPAAVTVLGGYLFALLLQGITQPGQRVKSTLYLGAGLALCGVVFAYFQPINKYLWTPTFVLVSAGAAGMCLSLFVWLWEQKQVRFILQPLRIYGTNPILIYVLAWLFTVSMEKIKLTTDLGTFSIKTQLFKLLSQHMPANLASFLYSLALVVLFYAVAYLLYRKNVIVRV